MDTISVIVPVYNVAPFLPACLDSILAQSYAALEIILVDDGSTDESPALCDAYVQQDPRVKVLHQPNGGVSSARNAGLELATGEWIGWVDSDDWIEPDMYEYLMENARQYGADIAVCGRVERYPDRDVVWGWDKPQVWDQEQALGLLLEDGVMRNYLCDKLWRRHLWDGIAFPEGQAFFEDTAVAYRLFLRAETIIGLPGTKYNYRQRQDSLVGNKTLTQRVEYASAIKARLEALEVDWPQYVPCMEMQCLRGCRDIWCNYFKAAKTERKQLQPSLKELAAFSRAHAKKTLPHMKEGLAGQFVIQLTAYAAWWAFALAYVVRLAYDFKHGKGSKDGEAGKT